VEVGVTTMPPNAGSGASRSSGVDGRVHSVPNLVLLVDGNEVSQTVPVETTQQREAKAGKM
jgi:hypothetical protein